MMLPNEYTLSGGMKLSAVKTDRFKTACLTVSIPTVADSVRSPLDTLLLAVLGRGTATYPTLRELNCRMDRLYDLTIFTRNYRMGDLQILGSGAYFLDPSFLPASEDQRAIEEENVRMLMDGLYAPLLGADGCFLESYTELEKTVQCDVIRDEKNQPGAYAEQRSRELTFASSPHGVSFYGTVAGVSSVTNRMLTERYQELLPHAPLRFFYVGSGEGERIAELIERTFCRENGQPMTDGGLASATPSVCRTEAPREIRRFEESLAVSQGKLVLTLSAGVDLRSSDLFTAMVYNEILGGSPMSKLFVNVREKKSLCYYCSSTFDFYKGYISIASGIRPENRTATEAEILLQIEEIRRGNVTERELQAAIRYLSSLYTSLYDSASAIENYFLSRGIYGVSCTPEECKRAIAAVTREDVIRFAERVLLDSVYFLRGTRTDADAYGEEDGE